MSIEDDIAAVRAGRGTPDQQMTVVSVLDGLLRPSGNVPKGIYPDPMEGRPDAFYDPPSAPEPKRASYDTEGYNNWGTRYHARCTCGSDMPTNMYGMGTCPSCHARRNPLTD